jgi:hypothetical protein
MGPDKLSYSGWDVALALALPRRQLRTAPDSSRETVASQRCRASSSIEPLTALEAHVSAVWQGAMRRRRAACARPFRGGSGNAVTSPGQVAMRNPGEDKH